MKCVVDASTIPLWIIWALVDRSRDEQGISDVRVKKRRQSFLSPRCLDVVQGCYHIFLTKMETSDKQISGKLTKLFFIGKERIYEIENRA